MVIIDSTLARVAFQTSTNWFECYLHHSTLSEKPYTVVEGHTNNIRDFAVSYFDDLAAAQAAYADAELRVKAHILDLLR